MRNYSRIASIATYNQRHDVLPDAIASLHHQVDTILVNYNGDPNDEIIAIAARFPKVVLSCISLTYDAADLAKFNYILMEPSPEDRIFLCDDDLIFAPDYCDEMERCLQPATLITLGGKVIRPGFETETIPDFNTAMVQKYRCFDTITQPQRIDVPLSGVAAFRSGDLPKIDIELKYKYAADVQLYKLTVINHIQTLTYSGPRPLVTYNPKMKTRETIWTNHTSRRTASLGQLVHEIYTQTL